MAATTGPPPPTLVVPSDPEHPWMTFVSEAFPNLQSECYFVPPLQFNKVPFYPEDIAGNTVQVLGQTSAPLPPAPRKNKNKNKKQRAKVKAKGKGNVLPPPHQPSPPPPPPPPPAAPDCRVAGCVYTENLPALQAFSVAEEDTRDDLAQGHVLRCLRVLAEGRGEVMVVLSNLLFRKYLDKMTGPLQAVTSQLVLPTSQTLTVPLHRGECDVICIHPRLGIVVCEIKSVGGDPYFRSDTEEDQHAKVVKRARRAVEQLTNQSTVLRHLVSDLGVKVSAGLVLPNVTASQLHQALSSANPPVQSSVPIPDTTCARGLNISLTKVTKRTTSHDDGCSGNY